MRNLIFIVGIFIVLPLAAAEPDVHGSESFTTVFAKNCMAYFYSQDKLRQKMSTDGIPALPEDKASFFLGRVSGTAWVFQIDGLNYVVSLRDDHVCAAFAQHASVPAVQENFTTMVSIAPPPLVASKQETVGPNHGDVETISYSWSRPEDKEELLFTLSTARSENHTVQAMASMALVQKTR